jgi:hypothetical protein
VRFIATPSYFVFSVVLSKIKNIEHIYKGFFTFVVSLKLCGLRRRERDGAYQIFLDNLPYLHL